MSRIAILSDIHFGAFSRTSSFKVPGRDIQDKSKEANSLEKGLVELLKQMKPKYFFVSGDLTSKGNPEEFCFCADKILSIAKKVGVEEKNIICVLGNHDIDWNIANLGEDSQESEDVSRLVKEKYRIIAANSGRIIMDQLIHEYEQVGPAPVSGVEERQDFVAFILNTGWYCTPDQKFSHGKLAQEQLKWFKEKAECYINDKRVKIILMHHHPFNYTYPIPSVDISTMEEGPELMEIAVDTGIDIIIHGHRHHPRIETKIIKANTKPITMICAGSLSVNAKHRNNGEIPNTIHFLDVNSHTDYQTIHNYKFTDAEGWGEIDKYSKVTPIDAVMKTGKIFSPQEINDSIIKYNSNEQVKLSKDDLDECLQFLTYRDLNKKFKELLSPTHEIVGEFPNNVVLLKK